MVTISLCLTPLLLLRRLATKRQTKNSKRQTPTQQGNFTVLVVGVQNADAATQPETATSRRIIVSNADGGGRVHEDGGGVRLMDVQLLHEHLVRDHPMRARGARHDLRRVGLRGLDSG